MYRPLWRTMVIVFCFCYFMDTSLRPAAWILCYHWFLPSGLHLPLAFFALVGILDIRLRAFGSDQAARLEDLVYTATDAEEFPPSSKSFPTGTVQRRSPEPRVFLLTFIRELLRTYHRYSFVPGTDCHSEACHRIVWIAFL